MTALPGSPRIAFARFAASDAEGLAALLADPEVTRTITADASTPEKCLATAHKRIAWHNGSWEAHGYGVWALRVKDPALAASERLVGWCGFTEPDVGEDPEILYGLARDLWSRGLATEAARASLDWLFRNRVAAGCSALIMGRLNPGSLVVAEKLGFRRRGTMAFADFLPDRDLARAVLDYEIWRLGEGECAEPQALLFQAPYKSGQIVATGVGEADAVLEALMDAAGRRPDFSFLEPGVVEGFVREAFREGQAEDHMEWYHLAAADWHG